MHPKNHRAVRVDEKLLDYATDGQAKVLRTYMKHGSCRAAAKELGVGYAYIATTIKTVKRKAAICGYAPEADMTKATVEPFVVRGTSTLYGEDGKAKLQWVKTRLDEEKAAEAIRASLEALCEDAPRVEPTAPQGEFRDDLLSLITLTDCHVGMRAWRKETGQDWDLKIAERTITNAAKYLIESAPKSRNAFICNLGDFLHYDSMSPVTPTNQHPLDADGRYPKVVAVATRIMRSIVQFALEHHEHVYVLMAEGNHDMASSVWLQHLFGLIFENEPRVTIVRSPWPYYAHRHGETMLAFHHGHLSKNDSLPLIFASAFHEVWGQTRRRYCHTGHRHHIEEKEHNGMVVIQHPTIAARDAYAARGGWLADRSMTAITYHDTHGEVARTRVVPEMIGE